MTDIKIHFNNHSYARVEAEQSIIREMTEYFSFEVDGARFSPKFKYSNWDGRIRLMGTDGSLPWGLVSLVNKFADNLGYTCNIDEKLTPKPQITRTEFDEWIKSKDIYSGDKQISPHWYQSDSVFHAINQRRAILNLPTSAGKSLIQALIARWYLENNSDKRRDGTGKVLIIVPTIALVKQMQDDFVDYRLFPRCAINLIGGGAKNERNNSDSALITVGTWQSLAKKDSEWFKQFGLLQNDECHLATGTNISKIIKQMTHCEYKFGLSGSLRDGKTNLMQYVSLFGEIFRPVDTAQLMEDGQVAQLEIKSVLLRYPDQECEAVCGLEYQQEVKYITTHKKRNKWVCSLATKLASRNENVLVLFRLTAHGKMMFETLQNMYDPKKIHFIAGETDAEVRNALRGVAEDETGLIIVASLGVMSTGVSIKQLHHLIFSHGTKSKILVLQSIGRVLRKHGNKAKAFAWDIVDNFGVKSKSPKSKNPYRKINYAFKHGLERISRYNQERFDYTMVKVDL